MLGLFAYTTANAQLETLVMPGEVIKGHADIEGECSNCHVKFERTKQRELCLACHEDIATDIKAEGGFHGRDRNAKRRECSFCHTDHEGRDANIVPLDEASFNHKRTDFPLEGHHDGAECSGCHEADKKHRDAPSTCFACHADDDAHDESLGTQCGDCHTPADWAEVTFDHAATGFDLIGHHETATCLSCHTDHSFANTPTTCFGCHAEDDAHDGRSGRECQNCHSPTDWLDTSFNHARDTTFGLTGMHGELSCSDCHSEDPFSDSLATTCSSCHDDDDNHDGHFGKACDTCHVTEAWTELAFDHNVDTNHILHGAHVDIECIACHIEPIFESELVATCGACHAEDDPHSGSQGETCEDCHNDVSWHENLFFDHDLTRFPLLGKHSEADCLSCHETQVFRDAPTECAGCHGADDPHDRRFSDDCASCHSPVSWSAWRFDHNAQTSFQLDGAHVDVACETCHRQSLDRQMQLGSRCADCHRADDIHNGEFGPDCARCHSTQNFEEVRQIR